MHLIIFNDATLYLLPGLLLSAFAFACLRANCIRFNNALTNSSYSIVPLWSESIAFTNESIVSSVNFFSFNNYMASLNCPVVMYPLSSVSIAMKTSKKPPNVPPK